MRLTLALKRAAILNSRRRTWPMEALANSVPKHKREYGLKGLAEVNLVLSGLLVG